MAKSGYVYIMANRSRTIYIGVTSDLERRVWEHKTHAVDGFTKTYDVTRLVYIAEFARIDDAIAWEKALKGKTGAKKLALIDEHNPWWNDSAWNWYDALVPQKTRLGSREVVGRPSVDCASRGDSSPTSSPGGSSFGSE